jgi:predicted 3-demethylubiquinone-9 3-methyltransferase (glyoxalase superfamily)
MQKIIPHLWYDKEAVEAAKFYTSVFPDSKITSTSVLRNTPSGDCDIVGFELWNHKFMSISAGPYFKFTPAISFIVNFDPLFFGSSDKAAREKIDEIWGKLIDGGKALMEIGEYPFSKRYGWVMDKYGLSWQLMLTDAAGEQRPPIIPSLLFVGNKCGKAEEAINFYLSVFKNAQAGSLHRYPAGMEPDKEGTVMFADFTLEDSWFAAMDSAHKHNFDFNEAVSLLVNCNDQAEIDYYWQKLSAVPEAEQCGWLKDKYGVSWQINPNVMDEMFAKGSQEQIDRVTQAFLPMKKMDIATLKKAYEGK